MVILAICASNQHGPEPFRVLSSDVKRAYLFAKAKRPIFIEIPAEDREPGDENNDGRLDLSPYGIRDAAMNWQDELIVILERNGFEKGKASPCNFHHAPRKISVIVHGDDFAVTGTKKDLKWFEVVLNRAYECKRKCLGPDKDEDTEIRIVNRVLVWAPTVLTYEADQRHVEAIIEQFQFNEAKFVSSFGTKEEKVKAITT